MARAFRRWPHILGALPQGRRRVGLRQRYEDVQPESAAVRRRGEAPAVALGDLAHRARPEAVVRLVWLGRQRHAVRAEAPLAVVEVLDMDARAAHGAPDDERDRAASGVCELAGGLDGVVERVAEERIEVRRRHVAERLPVRGARERDPACLADQAFLGKDRVERLVARLYAGVVEPDLAGEVVEHGAVHDRAARRELADLVAQVVAFDVDGLDVLLRHA